MDYVKAHGLTYRHHSPPASCLALAIPILVAQLKVEGGGILTGSEPETWSLRALMQSDGPLRLQDPGLVVVHRRILVV